MKTIILFLILTIAGCASAPKGSQEIIIRLESEVPGIELSIYPDKDCRGNYNFCKYN